MSSIAQYLIIKGYNVMGYDLVPSSITDLLKSKGVKMFDENSINDLSNNFKDMGLEIIYSSAIKNENIILSYFIDKGYKPIKRAVFLALLVNNTESYAIAGTHGKTTTSAILTHIFKNTNTSFSAFVGGIMLPEKTNFIHEGFDKTVVEADEFDRSFLNLRPYCGCITSIDSDHLDIYKNHSSLKKAFKDFSKNVTGQLIIHHSINMDGLKYGLNTNADYVFKNCCEIDDGFIVDVNTPKEKAVSIFCKVIGKHNLENMLAALSLANQSGLSLKEITPSLGTFEGIERRMTIHNISNKKIVDDYAHHPTEIAVVNKTLREKYPNSFIEVVFQPHLFSRTKDFLDEFATELSKFDRVRLMEIYPARETPIDGINSTKILNKISVKCSLIDKNNFDSNLDKNDAKIIAVLGAGSIGAYLNDYLIRKI